MSIRPVKRIIESKLTIEGAGVKLRRAFAASRARTPPRSSTIWPAPRARRRRCGRALEPHSIRNRQRVLPHPPPRRIVKILVRGFCLFDR
jgi:hypothetical protein